MTRLLYDEVGHSLVRESESWSEGLTDLVVRSLELLERTSLIYNRKLVTLFLATSFHLLEVGSGLTSEEESSILYTVQIGSFSRQKSAI